MRLPRRPRFLLLLVGVPALTLVAAGIAVAWSRSSDDGAAPGAGDQLLVFAEFGQTADRIYSAPATTPSERTLVATVDHAPGWGLNPGTGLAGSRVAYTVLPGSSRPDRDSPAELWLLDVATRTPQRMARDADLLVAPLFDLSGQHLVYRSSGEGGRQSLVRLELATGARRVLHTAETIFGVYPVGFTRDGALLFTSLSTTGTDLYRLAAGGSPELLLHASDHIARDWRLSPNGRALSYLAPELRQERVVHRVQVFEVDGGSPRAAPVGAAVAVEQFAPVWRPDGEAITVGREAQPEQRAAAVTLAIANGAEQPVAAPQRGFDVPLGWSPDGRWLAVRSFDGSSAYNPGRESLVVVSEDGQRRVVTGESELLFLGWLAHG